MLEQLLNTIILGLIQGFTEWLPISSTAHLRIGEQFLGLSATPLLSITLHLGTLVAVIFYFRRDVGKILVAFGHLDFHSEKGRLIPLILIATIPTAVIGLLYVRYLEATFQTLLIIGVTFLIGATILYSSRLGKDRAETISLKTALIMGFAQGFAVFPGLSRSGVTISTALLLGVKRQSAFRFSFLLSIPAVVGDLAVEAYAQRGQLALQAIGPAELSISVIVAMLAGYIAIKVVSKVVTGKRFHYFAVYTSLLGVALIAFALTAS